MKANELMIGDWVKIPLRNKIGRIYRIDETNGKGNGWVAVIDGDYHESNIEPIPLTPEILEKNGFSKEGYSMGIVGFSKKPTLKEDGYEVFIWTDRCLQIEHGFTTLKIYIKYVHQLQHALRHCGIKKEIEL